MKETTPIYENEKAILRTLEEINAALASMINGRSERKPKDKNSLDEFNACLLTLIHLTIENRELLASREIRRQSDTEREEIRKILK